MLHEDKLSHKGPFLRQLRRKTSPYQLGACARVLLLVSSKHGWSLRHLRGVQAAKGGGALVAGLLVAWFGVLVGARGPLAVGAGLAVVQVVFPLGCGLLSKPAAW
jgi:hypothetical protein